jgi:hypothetical protein
MRRVSAFLNDVRRILFSFSRWTHSAYVGCSIQKNLRA